MRATRSEFNEAQKTYKDSEIVQGYKAVKTAIHNLQDAVDGKGGDLKTCQEQLEKSSKELLPKLTEAIRQQPLSKEITMEDVQDGLGFIVTQIMFPFKKFLNADASKFIQNMAKDGTISKELQVELEGLNPCKVDSNVEEHNNNVKKQCNNAMYALQNLRNRVKEKLPKGHERTESLKEINQSFEKLRNLKRNKQANADTSLGQCTKLKKYFKAEFEKITGFQAEQIKRLEELKDPKASAEAFNENIKEKCGIWHMKFLDLQSNVEKLPQDKERAQVLAEIKKSRDNIESISKEWAVNAETVDANSLPNLTKRQQDFDAAFQSVVIDFETLEKTQTKRLNELENAPKAAEDFYKGIEKKCDNAEQELKELLARAQKELPDTIKDASGKSVDNAEKIAFLTDITKGIEKINNLRKEWIVNANSLPNFTKHQQKFDEALNDVMKLKFSANGRYRLTEIIRTHTNNEAIMLDTRLKRAFLKICRKRFHRKNLFSLQTSKRSLSKKLLRASSYSTTRATNA